MRSTTLLLFVASVLLSACGSDAVSADQLLPTLTSADQMRVLAREREEVIESPSDILAFTQELAATNRTWRAHAKDLVTGHQIFFLSRAETCIAWGSFAEDHLIIEFYRPRQTTISTSLSTAGYERLARLMWRDKRLNQAMQRTAGRSAF